MYHGYLIISHVTSLFKREGEDKTTQNLLKPTNLKTKTKPNFANHQNPDECSLPIPI